MPKARPPENRLECEELGNPTLLDGCRLFHLVQPASTHKTISISEISKILKQTLKAEHARGAVKPGQGSSIKDKFLKL